MSVPRASDQRLTTPLLFFDLTKTRKFFQPAERVITIPYLEKTRLKKNLLFHIIYLALGGSIWRLGF